MTKLTPGSDNFPAWSPNGDLIAFTRFSEDDYDIYTIRPDGTGLKRLTTRRETMRTKYGLQMESKSSSAAPVYDLKTKRRFPTTFLNPMANSL